MTDAAIWAEANRRFLLAHVERIRGLVSARTSGDAGDDPGTLEQAEEAVEQAAGDLPSASALEMLGAAFSLTEFERDVLLLCAGVELDAGLRAQCAATDGATARGQPTLGLALAALPGAHWSAVAPGSALRRFHLIEVGAAEALVLAPLRIDERILLFLTGLECMDERLDWLLEEIPTAPAEADGRLPASYARIAAAVATRWSRQQADAPPPIVHLSGADHAGRRIVATAACEQLGIRLRAMSASDLPASAPDRDRLARLWEREAMLDMSALLIECDDADGIEMLRAAVALAERIVGLVAVGGREPLAFRRRAVVRFDVPRPASDEQQSMLRGALAPLAGLAERLDGALEQTLTQFNLGPLALETAGLDVLSRVSADESPEALRTALWDACRVQARPRLDGLAQRIEPSAGWDDLVLPVDQRDLLEEIAANVRQRAKVYERWGFANKGSRGLGISALFAGVSGTGKTLAGEVLARELRLDLYRVDLSQVVSKYIGETEKNLRRIFDAAEEGGAILLFDEADALFGKRSEVKDSHDRYANIEVSYLLQRMEAYRGLAVLTSNMRSALDTAFLRRIRFVVEFPFPDATHRAEIWRRVFPSETPVEPLDYGKLGRLHLPGGNIRNIALQGAFLAADAGEPVCMAHLARAARSEFAKLEKPLSEADLGGWR